MIPLQLLHPLIVEEVGDFSVPQVEEQLVEVFRAISQQRVLRRGSEMPVPTCMEEIVGPMQVVSVEILVPAIRDEIVARTLLVPLQRMPVRVAEQCADLLVARLDEIVGGGQLVPSERTQGRVMDQIADFSVSRRGDVANQEADSLVPLTIEGIARGVQ